MGRNWQWRALPECSEELAQKIHRMMVLYERVSKTEFKRDRKRREKLTAACFVPMR
ncbi:MAG: hypothetical protein ACLUI7_05740 [Coprococcus sp.]